MFVKLLTFMLVASPAAFKVTRRLFGEWVAGPEGLATIPGLLLHAIVFLFLVTAILARTSGFVSRGKQQDAEAEHYQDVTFMSKSLGKAE